MPSGRFGKAALAAATNTDLYTVPAGKVATADINVVNTTAAAINVRLAVRDGALADSDYIEHDWPLPAHGVLHRDRIALGPGETVVAWASAIGVSVRVHGFEEAV